MNRLRRFRDENHLELLDLIILGSLCLVGLAFAVTGAVAIVIILKGA